MFTEAKFLIQSDSYEINVIEFSEQNEISTAVQILQYVLSSGKRKPRSCYYYIY